MKLVLHTFFAMLCIGFSPQLAAQVTWTSNPDVSTSWSSDFDAFSTSGTCNSSPNSGANRRVLRPTVSGRGRVWRIEKDKGQLRAELSRTKGFQIGNNQNRYYAWEMRIQTSSEPTDDVTVFQWKSDENDGSKPGNPQVKSQQNYPINMEYVNGYLELCAWRPQWPSWDNDVSGRISISQRKVILWKYKVTDSWNSYVLRIKAHKDYDGSTPTNRENNTTDKPKGFVEFWFNGVKQKLDLNEVLRDDQKLASFRFSSDKKRAYVRTYDGIEGVYPKWGIYNQESCKYDMDVYLDNMQVTQRYSDVSFSSSSTSTSTSSSSIVNGGVYMLRNVATGRYLDSDGAATRASNGGRIKCGTSGSGSDKRWKLTLTNNGYYNINNMASGRGCVDSDGNGKIFNNTVESSFIDDKEWKAVSVGGGKFRFNNRVSGRANLYNNTDNSAGYNNSTGTRAQWELIRYTGGSRTVLDEIRPEVDETFNPTAFPNPTGGRVIVRNLSKEAGIARVFTLTGALLQELPVGAGVGQVELDLATRVPGVYMISVTQGDNHKVLRVTRR